MFLLWHHLEDLKIKIKTTFQTSALILLITDEVYVCSTCEILQKSDQEKEDTESAVEVPVKYDLDSVVISV